MNKSTALKQKLLNSAAKPRRHGRDIPKLLGMLTAEWDTWETNATLAARYGVGVRTIERWVAHPTMGFPRPVKFNPRRVYYSRKAVEKWEAARREQIEAAVSE